MSKNHEEKVAEVSVCVVPRANKLFQCTRTIHDGLLQTSWVNHWSTCVSQSVVYFPICIYHRELFES